MELGYNPKAILGGPGVNFGFYRDIFGPAAEGVLGWTMRKPQVESRHEGALRQTLERQTLRRP